MRDHAIVSPHFWTGTTGRQLRGDPDAQRLALYLMTCPSSNMIGLYYLPLPLLCHELGICEIGARKGLDRLYQGDFCSYDGASEVVFVHEMARFQIGEVIKEKDLRHGAVLKLLAQMKNCPFYNKFLEKYGLAFRLNLKPLPSPLKPPPSPFLAPGKGVTLVDQDQDKEKEKEQDTGTGSYPRTHRFSRATHAREGKTGDEDGQECDAAADQHDGETHDAVMSYTFAVTPAAGLLSQPERHSTQNGGMPSEDVSTEAITQGEAAYQDYTPGFLQVCAAHPQQPIEGKKQAFGMWQALKLEPRAPEIAEKLARLVVTHWQHRTYYPLLKTWLKDKGYDDDLVPLEVAQPGPGHETPVPTNIAHKRTFVANEKAKFTGEADAGSRGAHPVLDGDGAVIDGVEYYPHR